MVRNLVLATVMVVTPYWDPSITYALLILVLQLSAALDHYFHPFALTRDNRLQVTATYCLMVACLAGLVQSSASHRADEVAKAAIIICVVLNVLLFVGIVATFLQFVIKMAYRRFQQVKADAVQRGYACTCGRDSSVAVDTNHLPPAASIRFVKRNCYCTRDGCQLLAHYLGCWCCAWRPRHGRLKRPLLHVSAGALSMQGTRAGSDADSGDELEDDDDARVAVDEHNRLVRVSTSGRIVGEVQDNRASRSTSENDVTWDDIYAPPVLETRPAQVSAGFSTRSGVDSSGMQSSGGATGLTRPSSNAMDSQWSDVAGTTAAR